MFSYNDRAHLKELVANYYPCESPPPESVFSSKEHSPQLAKLPQYNNVSSSSSNLNSSSDNQSEINPEPRNPISRKYLCCQKSFSSYKLSVGHWIKYHHLPAIVETETLTITQHGTLPRVKVDYNSSCQSFIDLGKSEYSLFERASYFLRSIKYWPSNLGVFRPFPSEKDPRAIKNPYSSALAMAYDFINIVYNPTKEYCYFLSCLLQTDKTVAFPGGLRDHLPYWYFWYSYNYPDYDTKNKKSIKISTDLASLKKSSKITISFVENPLESSLSKSTTAKIKEKSKKREFTCDRPGCNKSYKQSRGLDYHKNHGKCLSLTQKSENHLPFRCTFSPCCLSYSSLTGLKYHIRKHHLDTNHSDQSTSIDADYTFVCPLGSRCYCSFNNANELRQHIIKHHSLQYE